MKPEEAISHMIAPGQVRDITGKRYGRLLVLEYVGRDRHRKSLWMCICDCGETTVVPKGSLNSGLTKSCGCLLKDASRTHGMSRCNNGNPTPEYNVWGAMISRCNNPNYPGYENYGGRGITVCSEWLEFANFINDMGNRPSPKHSIDRKDNDGNYEPGNCRWATKTQQDRNRRTNRVLNLSGKSMCIIEWAEETGLSSACITWRIENGWTVEQALTTPSGGKRL